VARLELLLELRSHPRVKTAASTAEAVTLASAATDRLPAAAAAWTASSAGRGNQSGPSAPSGERTRRQALQMSHVQHADLTSPPTAEARRL